MEIAKEEPKCPRKCGATSIPYRWWSLLLPWYFSVVALFVTGFTHDLLQECGVFLVSVKLIMMSHKNGVAARQADERLENIENLLQTRREQSA